MATTTIIEASSTTGSFMLPGMSSPEPDASARVVRFDKECVLIPEVIQKSKMPMVVTKSYSLPLWRRKGYPPSDSDVEDASGSSARPPSPDDSRVVIKVPIPSFRRRPSRSPTRGRSVSSSPVIPKTLPSCLVYRSPSASPSMTRNMPLSPVRRPSLPIYHRRQDEVTVPLRPCCEACERGIEESLKEGENWEEKFTRGAKRRRSASLDNDINALFRLPSHARTSSFSKEFSAVSASLDNMAESARYGSASTFSLTVDEVDKRRKSYDFSKEPLEPFLAASPPSPGSSSQYPFPSHTSPYSGNSRYSRSSRPHDRELSSNSTVSSSSTTDELLLPDIADSRYRLRSSPIEEEDEAQLFPLPSPRRTPSPRVSPVPSPNGSTSCLPATAAARRSPSASSSKESVASKNNSSQESLLKASLSRKPPAVCLAAPTLSIPRNVSPGPATNLTRSPSPLASSPIDAVTSPISNGPSTKRVSLHGLKIATAPTAEERATTSAISPKGPRPSSFSLAKAGLEPAGSKKESSTLPPSQLEVSNILPTSTHLAPFRLSMPSSPSPIPIPGAPGSPTTPTLTHSRHASSPPSATSQLHSPFHLRSTSTTSMSSSPPSAGTSPVLGHQKRKHSFTLPFIKAGEALRDVSVDVLKGVSSMSNGGMVGST